MPRRQTPSATNLPKLVGGPYKTPAESRGDWLYDEVTHERRQVAGWVESPVKWPVAEGGSTPYRPHIVCKDLLLAIYQESNIAVQYWFGATESMVTRWRRALNVSRHNKGTASVYRERYADKAGVLAEGRSQSGPISKREELPPERIREIRQQLGLSQAELAEKLWVGSATIQSWEQGRRVPGGPERRLLGLLMDGKI